MSYSNHGLQVSIPPPYYASSPYDSHFQPPQRPETSQRKRPKYTRSKTGCLTCRIKKIKCDETKPSCMRCTHGSRECIWPEGVPVRKKSTAKKDLDGRPSTAGSSGLSDASASPTREHTHTPPTRPQLVNTLPVPSQSSSDNFVYLHPMSSEHSSTRREPERGSGYMPRSSNPNILSMIPESLRYDTYLHHPHSSQSSRHTTSCSYRTLTHQPTSHWNPSSNPSSEELNPHYHSGVHERTVPGHSPQYDHSNNRYQ